MKITIVIKIIDNVPNDNDNGYLIFLEDVSDVKHWMYSVPVLRKKKKEMIKPCLFGFHNKKRSKHSQTVDQCVKVIHFSGNFFRCFIMIFLWSKE